MMLVGNPTCWCCVPKVETVAKASTEHACCALKETPASDQDKKKSDPCACEFSRAQRDAAKAHTSVPPLVALALPPDFSEYTPASVLTKDSQVLALSMDTGPPRWTVPLFQRYCSRLL